MSKYMYVLQCTWMSQTDYTPIGVFSSQKKADAAKEKWLNIMEKDEDEEANELDKAASNIIIIKYHVNGFYP